MKFIYSILFLTIFLVACQPKVDNSAAEAFEKNSQTVLDNLKAFQEENVDYSQYASDFVMRGTSFGSKDSLSLEDVKKSDKWLWDNYDLKLITDPLVLLPGVNPETKMADGSVRYYGEWQVTLPATDSTEAKSGVVKYYESYDFDADGKILYQQGYGDTSGLFDALHDNDDDPEDAAED